MEIRSAILHSLLLVLLLLFLVDALNTFQPTIYPTQNRITYYVKPAFYLTGSSNYDLLLTGIVGVTFFALTSSTTPKNSAIIIGASLSTIILATLLLSSAIASYLAMLITPVLLISTYLKSIANGRKVISLSKLTWIFSILWIGIEIISLFYSISILPQTHHEISRFSLNAYDILFYGLSVLKAPMAVALVFSFLIGNFRTVLPWKLVSYDFLSHQLFSSKFSISLVIISFVLSFVFIYLPYSAIINPQQRYVSVDEHDYLVRLDSLDTKSKSDDIAKEIFVKNGERPIFILFLYSLKLLLPNLTNLQILRLVPYLIWPAFLTSVFYITLKFTCNRDVAVLAIFATSISSQLVVMLYGGFFANFVALSIAYFALLCVYKMWRKGIPSLWDIVIAVSIIAAILFTHVYTWTWIVAVLIIFGVISFITDKNDPTILKRLMAVSVIIIVSIAIDYIKITELGAVGGIERDVAIASESISDKYFLLRWDNLIYGFNTYLGGFIISIVFLSIAVFWTLKFEHNLLFDRMILSTIYALAFIFLFGDYVLQTRLFLNIPIGIIVSIVLFSLIARYKQDNNVRSWWKSEQVFIIIAVITFSIHYLYLSISNFVFPPS